MLDAVQAGCGGKGLDAKSHVVKRGFTCHGELEFAMVYTYLDHYGQLPLFHQQICCTRLRVKLILKQQRLIHMDPCIVYLVMEVWSMSSAPMLRGQLSDGMTGTEGWRSRKAGPCNDNRILYVVSAGALNN